MSHSFESEADLPSTSACRALNLLEEGRRSADSTLGGRFILGQAPRGLSCALVCRLRLFGLEQNIIDTAVNERRKRLLACVRIVGQHFKQFNCRQLKNGQVNEMSTTVSEM